MSVKDTWGAASFRRRWKWSWATHRWAFYNLTNLRFWARFWTIPFLRKGGGTQKAQCALIIKQTVWDRAERVFIRMKLKRINTTWVIVICEKWKSGCRLRFMIYPGTACLDGPRDQHGYTSEPRHPLEAAAALQHTQPLCLMHWSRLHHTTGSLVCLCPLTLLRHGSHPHQMTDFTY